jgi:ribonucleoside-triphosphate reductase
LKQVEKYTKYQPYLDFIERYKNADNAADGSERDANANVENKNITTMEGELFKGDFIGVNRLAMWQKIKELYDEGLAEEYLRQLEEHEIYRHDETALKPYCVSITMYPFLFGGITSIGGLSDAPTNIHSYTGGIINLVFAIASQFAGAVSTPEFLPYFDYFLRKEYGDDYYLRADEVVDLSLKKRTIRKVVEDLFQQAVYSLNQPAAARNFQSVFWNIAYYDEPYFKGLFQDFVFPDGSPMIWESTSWLQETFMNWFNEERKKKILTFPVESISLLHNGKEFMDPYWKEKTAEMWAKGHSFFCYTSDSVDSLSSCCRLKNEIQENTFSFTLGAGGVSTGSKCVMTMNVNRLVQNATRDNIPIEEAVAAQTEKLHKYLLAFNAILKENLIKHMLPIYEAGFISLDKQYLTIGINGFVEGAEFLGIEIAPDNPEYISYGEKILKPIYLLNKRDKDPQNGIMFNTEFVPAENLGVKFAKWDKRDGYFVPRDCYNSYFYLVEDETKNVLDKFKMSGKQFTQYLDGGSAYHCNLSEHLSKDQYLKMLDAAMITGCPYFTFNIPNTICNDCGHIDKHCLNECPACGSKNLDYATRVIGYLKRVSCFSKARREEAKKRAYIHG